MRRFSSLSIALAFGLAGCVLPVGLTPEPSPSGLAPVAAPPLVAPVGTTGSATTSLKARQAALDLTLGAEQDLNSLVVDEAGLVPTSGVIWLSSNDKVATVNPTSGQVKALASGTAVITAVLQANPAAKAQIEVRVGEQDLIKTITIEPGTAKLEAGGQVTLRATVNMADGTINANVSWASSDETVATVNPTTGEVTALKDGRVTIEGRYAPDPRFKGVAIIAVGDVPATPPPGSGTVLPGGEPGEVVNTAPKGKWVAQVIDGVTAVKGVWFRDAQHGWLQAAEGLFASSDAGTTWSLTAATPDVDLDGGVAWFDAGTAIGASYHSVLRTVDGGVSWDKLAQTLPAQPKYTTPILLRAQVVGPQEAYVLVSDLMPQAYFANIAFHSTDAGVSWSQVTWPELASHQIGALVAVGGGELALTSRGLFRREGGGTWTSVAPALTGGYAAGGVLTGALATVPNSQTVFAAGQSGVMRSDDAGKTWLNLGTPETGAQRWGAPHTLSFSDARHGLAVGTHEAFTTSDGGKTWVGAPELTKSLAIRDGGRIRGGVRLSADRALVAGHDGVLYRFVLP